MAKRRRRGVVLTPEGLDKFQSARLKSESEHNYGERYTYEKLSEITYLDIHTIKRVLDCQEGVDKRTLERLYISFELELTEDCYTQPNPHRRRSWGEAMCVATFYGRTGELSILEGWLLKDRCRIVTLLGMGGVGKTCLSVKLARQVQERYDLVYWCSLRDAPPVEEVLINAVEFLSDEKETAADLPDSLKGKISRLIEYLRESRCLLVLDNMESMLCSGKRAGQFREGYEGYGELLRRLGETEHQSNILLTSREKPKQVAFLEGEELPVRTFRVGGLAEEAGEELLKLKGLSGTEPEYRALIEHYGGNPLALKVVATTIRDLFAGDIGDFLAHETAVFGDIRDLLDQQFERLSDVEKEIVYWLAINRESSTIADVQEDMVSAVPKQSLLEGLESLSRRSLVERDASRFTLQNVVMEYVINCFVERVCQEIVSLQLKLFRYHAVIKATAKDYVRETQTRLVLQPILDGLTVFFKCKQNVEGGLNKVLSLLREGPPLEMGYAGGNVLNLLCHLGTDLTGYDFSNLAVWQADLRCVCLHDVNFQNADLSKSAFAEAFGGIWSVAFSPDGTILAVGDTKGEILLRQVENGRPICSFKGHNGWVVSLAFSPNSNTLASSSCDCTAKLWDINTGQCLHTLKEHTQEVWSVLFSPDSKTLVSGCDDNKVRLWDVSTGKCFKVFQGHTDCVLSVVFNLDGREILSGSHDNTIRLWDIESGKCKKTFHGHDDGVRSLAVSSDGQTFASSSNDCTIRLWNIQTGECLKVFQGHTNVVLSVDLCLQSSLLASSSIDQTVRLWDVGTGECLKVFHGHSNYVNSVDFSPQNNFLASGSHDQTVRLWNTKTYQCFKTFQGHNSQALSVVFSPDGQMLASGGHDQKVRLWDIGIDRAIKTLHEHTNWVWSVAFSPQGNLLVSGSGDRTVRLWNVSTGKAIKIFQGHQAVVRSVAFSSDNCTLASGSEDKTIRLWDINTSQTLGVLQGHQAEIWSIAFSPDGQMLASSSLDGTAKLWDVHTGSCLKTLEGHTAWVWSVAFCPDNKTLATTSPDQTLRLWDVGTGECKTILHEDIGYSQLVAFSKDGRIIASCNHNHNIRLWKVNTKECFKVLPGHKALINSIAFCPDNYTLVSSSEDETIKFWNIRSGDCIKTLKIEKPYEDMNLMGVTGLTEAAIDSLKELGAISSLPDISSK
ncbi:MAG: NB-ARC domain-containing protein [Cyanophyceae cyanobacterium]